MDDRGRSVGVRRKGRPGRIVGLFVIQHMSSPVLPMQTKKHSRHDTKRKRAAVAAVRGEKEKRKKVPIPAITRLHTCPE